MNAEKTPFHQSTIDTGSIESLVNVSEVHLNVSQEVIVTTEDKMRLCLSEHLKRMEKRKSWVAPLGILGAIVVTLVTSTFKDMGLDAATWKAVFIITGLISLCWLIHSVKESWNSEKMEDIINRGGGILKIQLYNSTSEEDLDQETEVRVSLDGVWNIFKAGGVVSLSPGESITLIPGCYHQFWAEGERVLVGEVSSVNDDQQDNRFHQPMSRFPEIEEDEPPLHLLTSDYSNYYRAGVS